jgi:ribosome-binding ATPase YchF (GTP1/OBG family)
MNRALVLLREGKPARLTERTPEEEKIFKGLGLLSSKPVLYVCNVEEAAADKGNEFSARVFARAKEEDAVACVVSAKIESEIAVLPEADQKDYLDAVGLTEPGLNRVIRAGYDLLHLVTYFTVGPKEARAWTITKGTKGPAQPASSIRISRRAISAPKPLPMKITSPETARRVRASSASSGLKARTMS